jgi:hypothetical protein
MLPIFSEGFVLGLSTGFYCLASCLPALLPWLLSEGAGRLKTNFSVLLEFLAGRFFAYLLFALVSIEIGRAGKPYLPARLAPLAMVLTALAMLCFLFATRGGLPGKGCLRPVSPVLRRIPLALGFMTGINLCPPFVAAFVRLVEMADFAAGLVYFAGFFTATSAFLLPALGVTPFTGERLKNIGRMTLFISGLWYLTLGLKGLF